MATQRSFNPRPREGATEGAQSVAALSTVSIHAPVKGRPMLVVTIVDADTVFQSTPP